MKNPKGLSLPELIIGIAIAGVAGTLLVSLLISSNNVFFNQSVKVSQGLSLNQARLEITDLIESASGIASQYPPSGTAEFTTNGNTLILKIPAIDQNGNILNSVFDYAVIYKDPANPKILRKQILVDGASLRKSENKVLSTSLSELKFVYYDINNSPVPSAEAVRVNFTINLSENVALSENESSASGTVNLKN